MITLKILQSNGGIWLSIILACQLMNADVKAQKITGLELSLLHIYNRYSALYGMRKYHARLSVQTFQLRVSELVMVSGHVVCLLKISFYVSQYSNYLFFDELMLRKQYPARSITAYVVQWYTWYILLCSFFVSLIVRQQRSLRTGSSKTRCCRVVDTNYVTFLKSRIIARVED